MKFWELVRRFLEIHRAISMLRVSGGRTKQKRPGRGGGFKRASRLLTKGTWPDQFRRIYSLLDEC